MPKGLLVILVAVTLDSVGIGLVFPILPELLREVAHESNIAVLYGGFLSLYALMQFVFAPVLGMLSDRFGRRPVLLVSLAGAAVDYLVLAFAPQLWMLVLGRAIAGITSANIAVATAYIADISPEETRAQRFGYLNACFGIGFILGPVIGGLLGEYWIRAPFLLAAVFNAVNFALALFLLPESRPGERRPLNLAELNPFKSIYWALSFRMLLPLVGLWLAFNFLGQVYGTIWVLFSEDRFDFSPMLVGLSLASFGVFHAGAQAFLTGPVAAKFGEQRALIIGMAFETTACLILAFATHGWILFALAPLFALGGVGIPALQSLLTRQVGEDKQGQLQGVLASMVSIASIFGPLFYSGIYFATRDTWLGTVWIVTVIIYLCCLPIILSIRAPRQEAPAA
ncbi:Tet(A)/Tet(B)/Tet(C) family tetracycline efflux MFS transporter [Paradevosia shaoguanensis]|uniref:Tet(A)/Tet(B)/Tet(C) family tetracycline efflux MFS transporter n=1 Tax=Paradevosia shaoguanensis TaxID=1335043 RepID=A0AA41UG61_9HYPH|nr:Tet(A)/Tet(B)/Tet(C) family tetracycline efflux MFS transporter [Paradevosia shaoguanensis]MCF1742593.1 Tet(A)/Tet(B)/Tet(C) family tetracycline efflux MFS transporter [Paradevosia shaoguanensis]MCI0127076.1 Tet(A)/Tet(B)/Tet(C) family tetracycline efflux MFS transporter [Paradevosia shaoguanensis]